MKLSPLSGIAARPLRTLFVVLILGASVPLARFQVLAGGVARSPMLASMARGPHVVHPKDLLASAPMPDWRVDEANTGRTSNLGPVSAPGQTFSVQPHKSSITQGIALDDQGNVIFSISSRSAVYSYSAADGTANWAATVGPISQDAQCPPPMPVLGNDGAAYIGDTTGGLWQITLAGSGAGTAVQVFSDPSLKPIEATAKLGPNNTIYVGDVNGSFYALTPPAIGSAGTATLTWTFTATGSTQTSGGYAGVASTSPFEFCGEPAIDPTTGIIYATSIDTNPQFAGSATLGTIYAINPNGTLRWKQPLIGPVVGAVVVNNGRVFVATLNTALYAFDAGTGTPEWVDQTFRGAGDTQVANFQASPSLSPDGSVLYVPDTTGSLLAINTADGSQDTSFGGIGAVAFGGGSQSSPLVDGTGTVFAEDNGGVLHAFAPSGTALWTLPGGTATGDSGGSTGKWMSPALAADGTIYVGSNQGYVRGFNVSSAPPTASATLSPTVGSPSATPTSSGTPTQTGTPTVTSTPSQTPTRTNTPTITLTPAATVSGQPTSTATLSPTVTPTQTPTQTSTQTTTQTPSRTPSTTVTPTRTPSATASASPTATATAVVLAPGVGWSRLGGDNHDDGVAMVPLQANQLPGPTYIDLLNSAKTITNPEYAAPAVGADGVVYALDGKGSLVAVNSDGSVKWTSPQVLGTPVPHQGSASGGPPLGPVDNIDTGSGPAVASDGTIFVGSESGGMYRFSPVDGSTIPAGGIPFYGKGLYAGSNLAIGANGTIYGASETSPNDGTNNPTIYAATAAGSQVYAYSMNDCNGDPEYVQSSIALATQGTLYVGFQCFHPGGFPTGGVVALNPDGTLRWRFASYKSIGTVNDQPVSVTVNVAEATSVMLSPDEATLYALDPLDSCVLAINTGDGSQKWVFSPPGGQLQAAPALSPLGDVLYESLELDNNGDANAALVAVDAGSGTVIRVVNTTDNPSADGASAFAAAPAVDEDGDVLVPHADGVLEGWSARLASRLFSGGATTQGTSGSYRGRYYDIMAGPVISSDGTLYITDKAAHLIALKFGVVVPTPIPTNTLPATPTPIPSPTDTVNPINPDTQTPTPTPSTKSPTPTGTRHSTIGFGGPTPFVPSGSAAAISPTPKPTATPTPRVSRTLAIRAQVRESAVFPRGAQDLSVKTTAGASLVYRITYAHGAVVVVKHKAGKTGADTLHFNADYTPSRAQGLVVATVAIDGSLGAAHGSATVTFTVRRADTLLQLKNVVVKVSAPVVKPGAVQSVDIASARGARVTCTVAYGSIRASYAVVADGSGYATLHFKVPAKIAGRARVVATLAVTAVLGRVKKQASASFAVQG